jgi:hypothetical protein
MYRFEEFLEIVKLYSEVYSKFEIFQKNKDTIFVPKTGDQKTGIIGEAFIFEYLSRQNATGLHFGTHSEKGWDIESSKYRYQVKTVSAFSKTKVLSPIHKGWHYLYLVQLDSNFLPERVLKIKNPNNWKNDIIRGKKFPKTGSNTFEISGTICPIIDETLVLQKTLNIKIT